MELTQQHWQFIDALLAWMTVKEASEYAGVSYATGKRWRNDERVIREFEQHCREASQLANWHLRTAAPKAVKKLVNLLDAEREQTQLNAADKLLTHRNRADIEKALEEVAKLKELIHALTGRSGEGNTTDLGTGQERSGPPPDGFVGPLQE